MFYISSGVGTVVGEELFIPPQTKVFDAWYWASRSCQIEQNFNRTHPMKSDMVFDEKKFDRVSRRNRKKIKLYSVEKTIYWYITKISYL